jgi:hypothetical protein
LNLFILVCFSIFHFFLYFLNNNLFYYFDDIKNTGKLRENIDFISKFIVDNFISKFVDVNSSIFYNLLVIDIPFVFLYFYIIFLGVVIKFNKFNKYSIISIFVIFLFCIFLFNSLIFAFTSEIINIKTIPFYVFIYGYCKKNEELKRYKNIPRVNGKVFVDNKIF